MQIILAVESGDLAVDPAKTQGAFQGLVVAYGGDARVLLGYLEPDAFRINVMKLKPAFPGRLVIKK